MLREVVPQTQLQQRLLHAGRVQRLGDRASGAAHHGAIFHRDQRLMTGRDVQQ